MQALCRQRVRHAGPAEPKPWGPPGLRCQCGARRGHAARALGSSSSSGPSSPASLSTTQPAELSQQQQQQDLKQQQQDLQPQPAASAAAAQPPPLPAPAPAPAVDYAPKDRRALWMAAIKPPMYSVGVVPVLVGAAAAFAQHGALPWGRVGCLLSGAICVIAWLNLRCVQVQLRLLRHQLLRLLTHHRRRPAAAQQQPSACGTVLTPALCAAHHIPHRGNTATTRLMLPPAWTPASQSRSST